MGDMGDMYKDMKKLKRYQRQERRGDPVRICRSFHMCYMCETRIGDGEEYIDGGYGNRRHVGCTFEETAA